LLRQRERRGASEEPAGEASRRYPEGSRQAYETLLRLIDPDVEAPAALRRAKQAYDERTAS